MKHRQNLQLNRTKTLFSRRRHDDAKHLERLEQKLAHDNLHRPELVSRMYLKSNLARTSGVIVHVSNLMAVKPYLNMVTLSTNLHRIPTLAVYYAFVLIHCKKHLAGTIERTRIAHRILVFEDVGLVRLLW